MTYIAFAREDMCSKLSYVSEGHGSHEVRCTDGNGEQAFLLGLGSVGEKVLSNVSYASILRTTTDIKHTSA